MYTILNNNLQVKGKLTLDNGQGSTAFFGDAITQQIATDNSTDPNNLTTQAFNETDKQGNSKSWGHSLTLSVENTALGSSITTADSILYLDNVSNKYYLMKIIDISGDRNSGFRTINAVNTAVYELGKKLFNTEKTYTKASLADVVKDVYKDVPFSLRIEDDLETVIDYTISSGTSAQAIFQDLQTKYDVDIDSWVELDNSGNLSERVLYFGHLGTDNGELIRYGGAKGFENITAQEVSDTIYTKLWVNGQTDDKNPNNGHIGSVNNGLEYIVDDDANAHEYPIGANQQQPAYLEGIITNNLLSEPQALLDWSQIQMSIFNHARFNYTVTPLHDQVVGIGDIVAVQDFHMQPMILVTSKVIQKVTSFASPETNTFVLGEFSNIFTKQLNKNSNVITLIKKDVTVVQEAADNARVAADEAHKQAVIAQSKAIKAQTSADGKTMSFTVASVEDLPINANEGDIAWVTLEDGTHGYTFINGHWIEDINPTLKKSIQDSVTTAISTAKADTEKAIADNNTSINNTINEVSQEKIDLSLKNADFNNKAQAMADEALADAKANTTQVAQATLNSANQNLADAKKSVTDDIAREASDRASAVSALDTKAQGYADIAKKNAIDVATSADGTINKKIDDTASSITSTVSQNKIDAEGKITTAQSTATQALNGLSSKVDTATYNAKTGQLSTDVTNVTQTANQAKTDIASIKQTDTTQDARMTTIEADASGVKTTVSDLQTAQGKQSGYISTLQQRADGFEATVTKVDSLGQVNQLMNTEFNPDLEGWTFTNSSGTSKPYKSYIDKAIGSTSIGFNTVGDPANTYGSTVTQDVPVSAGSNGIPVSMRWDVRTVRNDYYTNLWLTFKDAAGVQTGRINRQWSYTTADNRWHEAKWENIALPDDTRTINVAFAVRENTTQYLARPMLVFGSTIGDYVAGNYNNNGALAKVKLTADQASLDLSKYTKDADGRIRKAQADITANANAITTKVSKTVYDQNNGNLTQAISKAQSTADGVVSTVGNYKTSNDGRVKAAESKIDQNSKDITARVTKTDYDNNNSQLNTRFTKVEATADGASTTVGKLQTAVNNLGQVNQLFNTEFSPDFAGWDRVDDGYQLAKDIPTLNGSNVVYIKSTNVGYDYLTQYLSLQPNTTLSFSSMMKFKPTGTPDSSSVYFRYSIMFLDAGGANIGMTYGTLNYNIVDWALQSSKNIKSPNGTVRIKIDYYIRGAGEAWLAQPMLVFSDQVGAYVAGSYNNNAALAQVKITADGVSSIVSDPQKGLSVRVQTAEGTLNTVKSTADGAMSKASQTANQISQEISDRKTGDNNTLQSSKDFTQSTLTSYDSGLQSQLTQTSSAILAKVSETGVRYVRINGQGNQDNLGTHFMRVSLFDSSGKDLLLGKTATVSGPNNPYFGGNNGGNGATDGNVNTYNAIRPEPNANNFMVYDLGAITYTSQKFEVKMWTNYRTYKGVTIQVSPDNKSWRTILQEDVKSVSDDITKPDTTINLGGTSSATQLSLFKDNWSIGITDNIGAITSGIVGNASQMSLISKNVTIDSPNTQITGTAWIKSAMIANGAIGTAQIGDTVITSAKIANLDVSKLTGDTITGFNFNVNRSLTVAPGGTITSDIVNMTKTDFMLKTNSIANSRTSSTGYRVDQLGQFNIDTMLGGMYSQGTITTFPPNSNTPERTGNYLTQYNTNNIYLSALNYSNKAPNEYMNISSAHISIIQGGDGLQANATDYAYLNATLFSTTGSVQAGGTVSSKHIMLNDTHGIVMLDNVDLYLLGANGNPVGMHGKSWSNSSLRSMKEHFSNVDPKYALDELLKTDIKSYNFIGDEVTDNYVSPIIDDTKGEFYIPKDFLDSTGKGVKTYSIDGYLIQAIKSLQEQITELKQG